MKLIVCLSLFLTVTLTSSAVWYYDSKKDYEEGKLDDGINENTPIDPKPAALEQQQSSKPSQVKKKHLRSPVYYFDSDSEYYNNHLEAGIDEFTQISPIKQQQQSEENTVEVVEIQNIFKALLEELLKHRSPNAE